MRYLSTAAPRREGAGGTAVLMVNLGTPQAPTRGAVRRYLDEFLLDPRVVEIPRAAWMPLLRALILPLRSGASAARYASVWTPEGSPLLAISERQQRAVSAELGRRGLAVEVVLAMRYGEPSIGAALERLLREGTARLLVLPMFPQYSATTSASTFDAVASVLMRTRDLPEFRWVRGFHGHPGYIEALRRSVLSHWQAHGRPERLLVSFHGLPRRNVDLGDPYREECLETARLLIRALDLREEEATVVFQSRFGRARWLEPYTADTLRSLARAGVGRVDVICPGFLADCLETLEEIGLEGRREFLRAGGRDLRVIPCLNDDSELVRALADLVQSHLAGWLPSRQAAAGT